MQPLGGGMVTGAWHTSVSKRLPERTLYTEFNLQVTQYISPDRKEVGAGDISSPFKNVVVKVG